MINEFPIGQKFIVNNVEEITAHMVTGPFIKVEEFRVAGAIDGMSLLFDTCVFEGKSLVMVK